MNVYFTVDTESSMGGAWRDSNRAPLPAERHVFCRSGDQELGIPLIVRLLERYGLRGTFFIETLSTRCLGDSDTRSVFDFLNRAGQDLQLHIHPNFRFYDEWRQARAAGKTYAIPDPTDEIGFFDESLQFELLSEAAEYFVKFAGAKPAAFRAGGYAASRSTMRCLKRLGIGLDTSFNPCYPDFSFRGETLAPNRVASIEGVWEVPVTAAHTRIPEGHRGLKFADCVALSFTEIRAMLDACQAGGQEHFVMVCHSFSAVKPKDETYADLRPDRVVIRRLNRTFRYLAENSSRFRVETMGALAARPDVLAGDSGAAVVPDLNAISSAVRKAVQAVNRVYWV